MSRYTIEMNFAKAKGQAKELDNAAARLERIASGSMEDAMSTISGNWKTREIICVKQKKSRKIFLM